MASSGGKTLVEPSGATGRTRGMWTSMLVSGLLVVGSTVGPPPIRQVASPGVGQLDGVLAVSAGEAWAVGLGGSTPSGPPRVLIEHWQGSAWAIAPSAVLPVADDTRLHALASVSVSDVWAVGSLQASGRARRTLAEHWDGHSWLVVKPPLSEPQGGELLAVAAITSRDVWAVGDTQNADLSFSALLEHWDGVTWKVVSGAALAATGHEFLTGVAAAATGDVWAVGRQGRHPTPVIEHWGGARWIQVAQPVSGYDSSLTAVSVVSRRDAWAVGGQNLAQTVTEHWDGTRWSLIPSPFPTAGNAQNILTAVGARDSAHVWAIGSTLANFSTRAPLAEHWDGTAWHIAPTPTPAGGTALLAAVTGPGLGSTVWMVGLQQRPPALNEQPFILRTTP